jgi:hypothetical protein
MAPRFVAGFDSAAAMLMSLSNYLNKKDFPALGLAPPLESFATGIRSLPRQARETFERTSGFAEAIPPKNLDKVEDRELERWVVNQYPQDRQYQAVMIGSSSGAIVHVGAALGIPWLPQTFLIPVRHPTDLHVDEPKPAMEWARKVARPLLENNPYLQLHHMWDPNQDRLMLERMTYFRVKRLNLGHAYKGFLRNSLEPGGTIIIVECQRPWPTTMVEDRHIFQMGALGGATESEFLRGSERVTEYLRRYGSHVTRWDAPEPDGDRPEAEWGFEPALQKSIERFARQEGYKVVRMMFDEPEHPSPLVADLYRQWYGERRMVSNRLLVESFITHEPYWALRTGSVPFWMKFNMEASAEWLEEYLNNTDPYDEIYITLFSHGVEAVGLPSIDRWRAILSRARKRGEFIGVDPSKFPLDFGTFVEYYTGLKKTVPARYPLPGYLTLERFESFVREHEDVYPVTWRGMEEQAPQQEREPEAPLATGEAMR